MKIDWNSSQSHWLINPRSSKWDLDWFSSAKRPDLPGHIWLTSSGTMEKSVLKWVALSKQSLLVSAQAVNHWLHVSAKDHWLCILPIFHVGGLSILARAFLANTQLTHVENFKWDVENFCRWLEEKKITLTSLVPAQVYDLVAAEKSPPSPLRAVLVGGGALGNELYKKASQLGWPLLATYGMTECSSQVATGSLEAITTQTADELLLLPHMQARVSEDGCLQLKSDALLSCYLEVERPSGKENLYDPKVDGWFTVDDIVELNGCRLKMSGRRSQIVKVGGELVNVAALNELWQKSFSHLSSAVVAIPCPRLENKVALVTEAQKWSETSQAVKAFNQQIPPFSRIQQIFYVTSIPKTELKKIKSGELLAQIGF